MAISGVLLRGGLEVRFEIIARIIASELLFLFVWWINLKII
jgi:hypothetical protein